jgi:DNA helicase II / ATP-dependent DNA helicase PcrA
MSRLNPSQQDAVNTLAGPMLVLAGAGTGKTRVVTFRVARLIEKGTAADRILAVTFTNKAAMEMQQRIGELVKIRKKSLRPHISTFHSLCVRILRRHGTKLGYPPRFAIYDRGDQESTARSVLKQIKVADKKISPGQLLSTISTWKSKGIRANKASVHAQTDHEHIAAIAYRRYQQALTDAGAVDFDDLLLKTEDLFLQFEDVKLDEANRFDHILIDEYQDTNESQYRIVTALAHGHRNLCVVGDDDQSIYAWRGAEVKHILNFKRDWPDAKVVRLEENYRSTAAIIQASNRLIEFNKLRHDKTLKAARGQGLPIEILQHANEVKEAADIVSRIRRQLQNGTCEPNDFAILFRTNEQPRLFETELRKAKIPYVLLGGQSFFDRKEVKDILAWLRMLEYPGDDISLLRVINVPQRSIGSTTIKRLTETAISDKTRVWDVVKEPSKWPSMSAGATRGLESFVELINRFRTRLKTEAMSSTVKSLIEAIQYSEEIERNYTQPLEREARLGSVQEIVNAIAEYEVSSSKPNLGDFLDDCALDSQKFENDKEKKLGSRAVALMTLHSAKGLEFPFVYMVGMEEGILPHHRSVGQDGESIDEERRLCYVGLTRAQEQLTLSFPLTRKKWGKSRDTIPSRFLYEINGQADNPKYLQTVQRSR